jgi:hypothetical protein
MHAGPFQDADRPRLVIAGATGPLGSEVLTLLLGSGRFASIDVLAREPITISIRGVRTVVVEGDAPKHWPAVRGDVGVVMFDPPRLYNDRERALWTPLPQQLPTLAAWMHAAGVRTLVVVLPHAQMRLPESLKRGLADLDEHAVAALGFERLLIIRSAQKPGDAPAAHMLARVAGSMLSIFKYMVPSSEQPVRATKVAQFVALALQLAPPGIRVASSETVWRAAQEPDMRSAVGRWLMA